MRCHFRRRSAGRRDLWTVRLAALGFLLTLVAAPTAAAQPPRLALVVGNGEYAALPQLPSCLRSANQVASALRALDYRVATHENVTSGGLAAAVGQFSREMDANPQASVVLYICGYATAFTDRLFLLPASANLRRPSDAITQGTLAKAMLDVVARGRPSRGLVALDAVPAPEGAEAAAAFAALAAVPAADGVGLIAVSGTPATEGPSDLSAALSAGLQDAGVEIGDLLAGVRAAVDSDRLAVVRMPAVSRPLAVDDEPPAPAAPESAPAAPAAPVVVEPTPPPVAPGEPSVAMPGEEAMSDGERRLVQAALRRIGYYSGSIDGIFGPETRAAIRRFQHEIADETTGRLTGEQATRLVNWE